MSLWATTHFVSLSTDVFEYRKFKTKAKPTAFCPRAVHEVEGSPQGPIPENSWPYVASVCFISL